MRPVFSYLHPTPGLGICAGVALVVSAFFAALLMFLPALAAEDRAAAEMPPQYRWEESPGESFALVGPYGIIWQLNYGPALTKPYFHPLRTTDGRPLTWIAPPDHPWHYGLWHSWKLINGVNYWEEDRITGRPDGVTEIVGVEVRRANRTGAEIFLRLAYHPAGKPESVVMDERIRLIVDMPREDGSYRILWRQDSLAREPAVLDRTPLPGEPNGKSHGGYGGLSFRGNRYLQDVSVVNSDGVRDMEAHRQRSDWMLLTGMINDRPAGVSIFDHPSNPRHPTPWFVVMSHPETGPFWYFNAAFVHDRPFTVEPGQPLIRSYLIRVDAAAPSIEALGVEFSEFSSRPL